MSSFNHSSQRFPAAPDAGEVSAGDQPGLLRCLDEIIRYFVSTQNGGRGGGIPPHISPVYHQVMAGMMMNNNSAAAAAAAQPGMPSPEIQDFMNSFEPTPVAPSYHVVQGTAAHSAARSTSSSSAMTPRIGSHNQSTAANAASGNMDNLQPLPITSDQQFDLLGANVQPGSMADESDTNHLDPFMALAGKVQTTSTNSSINENLQCLGVDIQRLLDGGAAAFATIGGDGCFPRPSSIQLPSSQAAEAKTGGQGNRQNKGRQVYQREQWFDNFKLLLKYREKHGHCNVPYLCEDNKALSQWVKRQRHQRKLKTQRRHSNLTDEREKLLDGIGFCWDSRDAAWDERYADLVRYYETHGHVRVSRFHDPSLSVWLKRQRHSCRMFLAAESNGLYPHGQDSGSHGRITKKRCQMLLDIGVELGFIKGAKGQEHAWVGSGRPIGHSNRH